MVPLFYLYGDPISVPSYVSNVNSSRAPSEQQVGAPQEERRTTTSHVKALENIITSRYNKVYEAVQLW